MTATVPRSFTEVPGWREAFRDAAKRLDEVRTGSLFPEIPAQLCGEPVRPLTLRDWTILDQADSPLVAGGRVELEHCCGLLWRLSPCYRQNGALARLLRRRLVRRVMIRAGFDEDAIIREVTAFIDDAFIDHPNIFAPPSKDGPGIHPTRAPRKCREIELCGEIMQAYPSFRYEELRAMPLAQFWQWLHDARASTVDKLRIHAPGIPAYRNFQLTDKVNHDACDALNRMRKEAAPAE